MKIVVKLAFLILVISSFTFYTDQCIRKGVFTNSNDIETKGKVEVKVNKKGKAVIVLQNDFKTQEGPDLDVYLSTTPQVNDSSLKVSKLWELKGYQKFVSTKSTDISVYHYVIIHCTQYNHWYGSAKLEDCSE